MQSCGCGLVLLTFIFYGMKTFLFFLLLFFGYMVAHAQSIALTQTVKGIVTDEQSGNILYNVTVAVDNIQQPITAVSDSAGAFKLLNVPIGRRQIKVSITGYEDAWLSNIEVTSSREVVLEIRMKEKVQKLGEVVIKSGKSKNRALNEAALISARQLSTDEAFRYAGTRSDPSRMAQNFAGVSGTNDGRNDIIIRGNSPAGVLWRMDGIDIPNPNHFSTLGSTGGPVSMLNINTLKNSDFLTSAFPSQYGNAIAGVFDLKMRNGNNEKNEFFRVFILSILTGPPVEPSVLKWLGFGMSIPSMRQSTPAGELPRIMISFLPSLVPLTPAKFCAMRLGSLLVPA